MNDKEQVVLPWDNQDLDMVYDSVSGQRLQVKISEYNNECLNVVGGILGKKPTEFITEAVNQAIHKATQDVRRENDELTLSRAYSALKEKRESARDSKAATRLKNKS